MTTVGLIGGIAPESTIDYYRQIIDRYRTRRQDGHYPAIIINSIDLTTMLEFVSARQFDELTAYLVREVTRLARAGADFALFASNTPHVVFDDVSEQSSIPLVSIVESACAAAQVEGFRTLGLLGTRFTMAGSFYPSIFERAGLRVIAPRANEQDFVHEKYMGELVRGEFLPETRARLVALINTMCARDALDAVILGGTELPLALRDAQGLSRPLVDTTAVHVEAVVTRVLEGRAGAV
jgi:aspartate racemase